MNPPIIVILAGSYREADLWRRAQGLAFHQARYANEQGHVMGLSQPQIALVGDWQTIDNFRIREYLVNVCGGTEYQTKEREIGRMAGWVQIISDGSRDGTHVEVDGVRLRGVVRIYWTIDAKTNRPTATIKVRGASLDATLPVENVKIEEETA